MPNRIIKESICTSDSIEKLSWFEEVLFYRLTVNCDDYGRFDGRVAVIKNRLFPLKDDLSAQEVKDGLISLEMAGLISSYEFNGKPYIYLPTWNDHQNVRAKRSKYPDPDLCVKARAYICNQVPSNVPDIQSVSLSVSLSNSEDKEPGGGSPPPITPDEPDENPKRTVFKPPSLEEVTAYCQERGKGVDPERWHNYYTANGWMVGRTKMKDWKAAVRTWEKKENEKATVTPRRNGNVFLQIAQEEGIV